MYQPQVDPVLKIEIHSCVLSLYDITPLKPKE